MRINWELVGQTLTVWGIVAFLAAPLVGRVLRKRRTSREYQKLLDRANRRLPKKEEQDLVKTELLISTMVHEQKMNAANAEWQDRARRAESLGFIDPDERPAA